MKLFEAVRVTFLFSILTTPFNPGQPATAESVSKVAVTETVNAPAKSVWDAIRSPEMQEHRRLISSGDREALVEETFDNIPLVHSSKCVLKEVSTPYKRIDYSMVKSDRIKSLSGAWILTPLKDGRTLVELDSSLDPGIHLPFARKITDEVATKICKQRIATVKDLAESSQRKVASSVTY